MSDSDRSGLALLGAESAPSWDLLAPRFPVVRRGYDRDAVDDYIGELERELEDMRAGHEPSTVIAAEIERIGEQTAAILRVAHEQASETTRRAHAEADRCLAAAAANAVAMTEDAKQQLRQLDSETDTVWQERARLLEDVRVLSTSLSSLAEDALERFPPEGERLTSQPLRAAGSVDPVMAHVAGAVECEEPIDDGPEGEDSGEQNGAPPPEAQTTEFHQDDLE
jgi:DivIVA domain-containing protein